MSDLSKLFLRIASKASYNYLSVSSITLRKDFTRGLKEIGISPELSPKIVLTLRYGAFFNVITDRFVCKECPKNQIYDVRAAISTFMGAFCDDDYLDEADLSIESASMIYEYFMAAIIRRQGSLVNDLSIPTSIKNYAAEIKKSIGVFDTGTAKYIQDRLLDGNKSRTVFLQSLFLADHLGIILERLKKNGNDVITGRVKEFLDIIWNTMTGQIASFNQHDLFWGWRNYVDSSYRKSNQIFKAIFALFSCISEHSEKWTNKYLNLHLQIYFDDFEDIEIDTKNKIATLIYLPMEQARIAEAVLSEKDNQTLYKLIFESALLNAKTNGSFVFYNSYFSHYLPDSGEMNVSLEKLCRMPLVPLLKQCLFNSIAEADVPINEIAKRRLALGEKITRAWGIENDAVVHAFYQSGFLNSFRDSLDSDYSKKLLAGETGTLDFFQKRILKKAGANINSAIKRMNNEKRII